MQGHLPFAVVGSTEEVKIGNKMVKARQYPWGTVQGKLWSHLSVEAQPSSAVRIGARLVHTQALTPINHDLGFYFGAV